MPLQERTDLQLTDELRALARRLDAAVHGEKGRLKQGWCELHGWSLQKLHRELRRVGWQSGRKRRRDAGTTRQDARALLDLAAALRAGVRRNGKATMEIPNARAVLAANGRDFSVSNGRLAELLRRRRLDASSQRRPAPHTRLRSLHPNHVHQVDPSLCLLFYTPDGRQHLIRDDEAYKNKPEYLERVGALKLWRYVLVDHYSNVVVVRYYQARGENQANLWDFLLHCWSRQEGRPFHGVPRLLVWDKGSANTSAAIRNALHLLEVDTYEHRPGNPQAKGAVEEANNRVEKLFESRLRFEPVDSVEALNAAAAAWVAAYNADAIPHYDARLKRRGMARPLARFAIWQHIRRDQLRLLPDRELCRHLLTARPQTRRVRPNLSITFAHPAAGRSLEYDLRGVPGVAPRDTVQVSPLVYGDEPRVLVAVEGYDGETAEHVLAPVAVDPLSGQRTDAPVWGERFARPADTAVEQAGKAADRAAYPGRTDEEIARARARNEAPFGGLDAHTHLGEVYVPDFMDRRGTELHVPDRTRVEAKPLSHIKAARALVGELGRPLEESELARIRELYPEGVPEEELPALAGRLRGDTAAQASRPGLAAVK